MKKRSLALVLLVVLVACAEIPEPTGVFDCQGGKVVIQRWSDGVWRLHEDCFRGCIQGACIPNTVPEYTEPSEPEVETPTFFCEDSDNGMNEFSKGVTHNATNTVSDSCLSVLVDGKQVSINKVIEYACDGSSVYGEIVDCEFGCNKGACLESELPKHYLVESGECKPSFNVAGVQVTSCYNNCLTNTQCRKGAYESSSVTLPFQLNCLAKTDAWVVEKWFEFKVQNPVEVIFSSEVQGSEFVTVEIRDLQGNLVSAPINQKEVARNRCFEYAKGTSRVKLQPGSYQVIIGAKGDGKDRFRSFKGENFALSVIP
jgi:hypothetical protein